MHGTATLTDRVHGCLLGGAIGNAMGSPVENWHFERIERLYGKIEMPLDLSRMRTEDDHQIAMLFTKAYLANKRNLVPEDLARTWLAEFHDADKFFWCLRNALELLRRGISPRQTGLYNINTGSAIMAISPVGIYHALDPDAAWAEALGLAYMYQPKPDAHCAAAMAAGFAEAFSPDATPASVARTILDHALDESLQYWDDRHLSNIHEAVATGLDIANEHGKDWWAARPVIYERLTQWHAIEPIEVLAITTCLFVMTGGNYEEGVIAGTNIGRDSDTIANLVGGLCGAMHGVDCIPADWREGVAEVSPALDKSLQEVSVDLAALIRAKFTRWGRAVAAATRLG